MKISVSYLSAIDKLDEVIGKINQTDVDYLHCDIMDNLFVPNITPSFNQIKEQLEKCQKPKDVHLMVKDVKSFVDEYKELKPEYITFHLEAIDNIKEMINYIKSLNIKVGISIKPNTSVETLIPYLIDIDLVLVMSVEPGFGGQSFIMNSVDKIKQLKELKEIHKYTYLIEVDGGINGDVSNLCNQADMLVVGNYITKSDDYQKQISQIIK